VRALPSLLPPIPVTQPYGCICPPTSEKTCEAPNCPRKNHLKAMGSSAVSSKEG